MARDDYDRLRRNLRFLLPIWSLAVATAVSSWVWRGVDVLAEQLHAVREEERGVIVTIPVYRHALGPGTVLSAEDLTFVQIPMEYLTNEVLQHSEEVLGRMVIEPVLEGDLVRAERLAEVGTLDGLHALVPRGQRAIALNLTPRGWVSDFVQPGNRVDLLATFPEADERYAETQTLLEGVRVIAVDEQMSETADGEPVLEPQVTLLIEPVQAERLVHSGLLGELKLTLRSELDFAEAAAVSLLSERIARPSRQMTLPELHARFDPEDFERMEHLLHPPEALPDLSPPELQLQFTR